MLPIDIDTVYPTLFIKSFKSGSNEPILVRAIKTNGDRDDVVVKLKAGDRMGEEAFLRELVGSCMAQKLGIKTPQPYIADITPKFIDSRVGYPDYSKIDQSAGLNFSSKYIHGLQLIGLFDSLSTTLLEEALKVFYFDVLILNPDRTIVNGKPNLFTTGEDLWILDHEIAFSFLFHIVGLTKTDPWEINPLDKQMFENHVLYSKLKQKVSNYGCINNFLDALDDNFWRSLESAIPSAWLSKSNDFSKIEQHVCAVRDHQDQFVQSLKELLS